MGSEGDYLSVQQHPGPAASPGYKTPPMLPLAHLLGIHLDCIQLLGPTAGPLRVAHQIQPTTKATEELRCPAWSSKNVAGLHKARGVPGDCAKLPTADRAQASRGASVSQPAQAPGRTCSSLPPYGDQRKCQPQPEQGEAQSCPSLPSPHQPESDQPVPHPSMRAHPTCKPLDQRQSLQPQEQGRRESRAARAGDTALREQNLLAE